jgi:hypothetical protein
VVDAPGNGGCVVPLDGGRVVGGSGRVVGGEPGGRVVGVGGLVVTVGGLVVTVGGLVVTVGGAVGGGVVGGNSNRQNPFGAGMRSPA